MTKRMLIDATHAEETRVVVLDGNRVDDFDVETSTKRQLKGNIYLARVVRVEPSLQAAFVEYGGGRHGFLAFGEIHPDYYQIPVADRQRILEMQAEEARIQDAEDEEEEVPARPPAHVIDIAPAEPASVEAEAQATAFSAEITYGAEEFGSVDFPPAEPAAEADDRQDGREIEAAEASADNDAFAQEEADTASDSDESVDADQPAPETLGGTSDTFEGNDAEEARKRRMARFLRNYRIQEVIRRRQILLVQVVKEERGTKGAALTTYISLAGRYCVLMPNSPRGGGISRKITSGADRRRLREITTELQIPQGMGLIVRTAGANRPKPEIKRDCEYLMRLWDDIRDLTLRSMAPALIYEEASLIKRAIRDGYSRDIDEVLVDGDEGWKAAHDFMRMLMPSHARKVQLWRTSGQVSGQPLFSKFQVESQLDAMVTPTVQLKSGGYLVINQTEALVAIDVNSGRSTRERGIEETALRTNLEAADEAARQLRLRDLAGLIVIDFIDMESRKHNAMVERRIKDALKTDRARIQLGSISHFGLLEMSRQRLRPSVTENSFVTCPHCGGAGHVRSTEGSAIHVLRAIEDEGAKARASHIMVHVADSIAMYLFNNKRERLAEIEQRYAMRVQFAADPTLIPPDLRIDRLAAALPESERPAPALIAPPPVVDIPPDVEDYDDADVVADVAEVEAPRPTEESTERGRRRRRRGGRREVEPGNEAEVAPESTEATAPVAADTDAVVDPLLADQPTIDPTELDENGLPRPRRRGRRGGRRRGGRREGEASAEVTGESDAEATTVPETAELPAPVAPPAYTGPTPADPFGGRTYDIFDIMEQVEQARLAESEARQAAAAAAAAIPAVAAAAEIASVPAETVQEPVAEVPVFVEEITAVEVAQPEPEPVVVEPAAVAEPAVVEPVSAPVIEPVLVTPETLPPTERKRGWWRR